MQLNERYEIASLFFQNNIISPTVFTTALREWRCVQFRILTEGGMDPFMCPACRKDAHAIHIDGNKKLGRFERNSQ